MQRKEVNEAIAACWRVLDKVDIALDELRKARNWGFADMLGGGFLMSLIKHGKMDQAEEAMRDIQEELRVLQRELQDVSDGLQISLKNTDLNRFFDIFFDNIFSDITTQSRINQASQELLELKEDIGQLKDRLEQLLRSGR